jgi:hypothetical protein
MEKIIVETRLHDELDELIQKLYDKEYFGFLPSAENCIHKIYDFINTIPTQKSKLTKVNRYGKYYCTYKANNKTSWYIIFDVIDDVYLISFITNNHSRNYPTYISGVK